VTVDWADEYDSELDSNKVQIHLSGINETHTKEELLKKFANFGSVRKEILIIKF